MSTSTAPTSVPAAPATLATQAAQAVSSADAVLSDLAVRRLVPAVDVDELAVRPAPNNLAKVAKLRAREGVQKLRSQAISKAEETVGQAKNRLASPVGDGTNPEGGADTYDLSTLTLGQRVSRLSDDARDSDPASLGIVTAAGLVLVGLSVTAIVVAAKVFRARVGRA